jgi:ankyrin repeat protein
MLVSNDSVTLHTLVQEGNQALVQSLLRSGYDVNTCNTSGMTPLRLAIQRKDRIIIEKLLKYKAHMKDIMVQEWRGVYREEAKDILQLSEGNDGEKHVRFLLADELPQKFDENEISLLYVVFFLGTQRVF